MYYDARILVKTMFFTSPCLYVLFTFCVVFFAYISVQHIVLGFFVLFVCMLSVYLDFPFFIAPSVFSNVYESCSQNGKYYPRH